MSPSAPTLPADLAEPFSVTGADGVALTAYAWRSAPAGAPALLFGHANGFNAGCYEPVLARLAAHAQVFTYDARGHGASQTLTADQPGAYAMSRFAADHGAVLAAVRARIGADRPLHFAAHSFGGMAGCMYAAGAGGRPWLTATLFEPPIYPPEGHPLHRAAFAMVGAFIGWARKRPAHYADGDAFAAAVDAVSGFRRFTPDMRAAYLNEAVARHADGSLGLRCPGPVESQIYSEVSQSGAFAVLPRVSADVLVFGGNLEGDAHARWTAPFMADVAAALPNGQSRLMDGCGHLMVMEAPEACVEAILGQIFGS